MADRPSLGSNGPHHPDAAVLRGAGPAQAVRSGWSAGIGSMRAKISAASTASHFSGSWACRSQTSAGNLTNSSRDLSDTIGRHIGQVDQRMAALGRHRERMITVRDSLATGSPSDEELLDILHEMAEIDHGLAQRLTLLVYDDIEAVHDHLVAVFGFGPGTITRDESGRVVHGELHVGDGVIWMHPPSAEYNLVSPATLGASTHCMAVMVDDVDRHHERAVAAGATVVYPPRDMPYGVREYAARDLEGGLWSFMTPINPEGDPI